MAIASTSAWPCEERISLSRPSSILGASTSIFSLPAFCCSSSIAATSFLISPWAMSSASRISCLGDAVGAGLDHQDRLVGAGDDQVELELLVVLLGAG